MYPMFLRFITENFIEKINPVLLYIRSARDHIMSTSHVKEIKPSRSNQLIVEGDGSAFAKDCLEGIINHLLVLLALSIIFILFCTLFWRVVVKASSHDPIFGSKFFFGIVSVHRNIDARQ